MFPFAMRVGPSLGVPAGRRRRLRRGSRWPADDPQVIRSEDRCGELQRCPTCGGDRTRARSRRWSVSAWRCGMLDELSTSVSAFWADWPGSIRGRSRGLRMAWRRACGSNTWRGSSPSLVRSPSDRPSRASGLMPYWASIERAMASQTMATMSSSHDAPRRISPAGTSVARLTLPSGHGPNGSATGDGPTRIAGETSSARLTLGEGPDRSTGPTARQPVMGRLASPARPHRPGSRSAKGPTDRRAQRLGNR